jgi:hypothetical protein
MKSSFEIHPKTIDTNLHLNAESSLIQNKIARSLAMNALGKAHKGEYLAGIKAGTTTNLIYNVCVDQITKGNRDLDDIRKVLLETMMTSDGEKEILALEKNSQPLISIQFLVRELKGGLELLTNDRNTALLVRYLIEEWKNSSKGKEHVEIAFTKLHESNLITDTMYQDLMNGTFAFEQKS